MAPRPPKGILGPSGGPGMPALTTKASRKTSKKKKALTAPKEKEPARNTRTDFPLIVNARKVHHPVFRDVATTLRDAWTISTTLPMGIIFDCVDPCRHFKKGTTYDSDGDEPFPKYKPNPQRDPDVCYEDDGQAPYLPKTYR